jgi:hypothetical protein
MWHYISPNNHDWYVPRTGSGLQDKITDPLQNQIDYTYDRRGLTAEMEEKEACSSQAEMRTSILSRLTTTIPRAGTPINVEVA